MPNATLIVFVRGFRGPSGGAGLRDVLKPELRAYLGSRESASPEDRSFAGYAGTRLHVSSDGNDEIIDIVEVDWESGIRKLSGEPIVKRMVLGLVLLGRGFERAVPVMSSSIGFLYLSLLGLSVILAWLYLTVTSVVGVLEQTVKDTQTAVTLKAVLAPAWPALHWLKFVFEPRGIVYLLFVAFVAVLGFFGIDGDLFADMGDTYDRYMKNSPSHQSLLGLRDMLLGQVSDTIRATAAAGTYDRVVFLGHSIGGLFAADAAARYGKPVELITVGTFFNYLMALQPAEMQAIAAAVNASPCTHWSDFFSQDDYIAATEPFRPKAGKYDPVSIRIPGVSLGDKILTRSHMLYFRCPEVKQAILQLPPSGISAST